jgi:hypothetical protein
MIPLILFDSMTLPMFDSQGEDNSAVGMDGVKLFGSAKRSQRLRLYNYMLESLSEEQRIHVTASLVDDVLSHAIDANALVQTRAGYLQTQTTGLSGISACEDALEDVFIILRSPLLKVRTERMIVSVVTILDLAGWWQEVRGRRRQRL